MKLASLLGLAGLAAAGARRDYDKNDYYVLHLDKNTEPESVASRLGLTHEGKLELADHHVFRSAKDAFDTVTPQIKERKRRKRDIGGHDALDGVKLVRKQQLRMHLEKREIPPPPAGYFPRAEPLPRAFEQGEASAVARQERLQKELEIHDPLFTAQWHLLNTVQIGHDINVTDVWLDGITGHNVTVAIIDDGLDMFSDDLKDNYFAEGSWDYNEHDPEPRPTLDDDKHGTRCAGEVSAARNNACGVGVAYDSKIAGIRILSGQITDSDEADALIYKYQDNHIYSCSWGPPDDGRHMEAPDVLISRAMLQGVQDGRDGKGSIYVFASGNGATHDDNCNFDGYTNSIYSVTVGAVDRLGQHPYYSEHCSAQLVVAYSSGGGDAIHTTDVGTNKCYSGHGGTSAAAPLAVGVYALVLQVRPDLTWRDIQYLTMLTAAKVEDPEADWQETTIGRQFSHTFGYGKIDAYAIVDMAKDWELVKPQAWYFSPWLHVKKPIPEGDEGLHVTFEVTEDMLKEANLERLEHVTVTMNVEHTRRGDISVDLISPDKIVSHIATSRKDDDHQGGYDDWTFMSVVHWGESGVGKWTLIIRDTKMNSHQGKMIDWHLKLWGEAIDADKAVPLPMPQETDDDDHDLIVSTVTPVASTASVPPNPEETHDHSVPHPSEHPVRPTKPASPTENEEAASTSSNVDQEPTASSTAEADSNWVSWLPSFGASKKTQIWIYAAVGFIGAFCIGLGIFLFISRRRRLRNDTSRNNYEFEVLDEEEREGLAASGEKQRRGRASNKRTRGGELYDAFAGGSDDDFEDYYSDRSVSIESRRRDEAVPGEENFGIGEESDDESDDGHEKGRGGRA